MSIPKRPPGKGGRLAHIHFTYVGTPPGRKWGAFIAGECHWIDAHTKGKTKPCICEMTREELTCELCSPFEVPQEVGYQPLYRECDGKPVMVIVYGYSRELVDALKFHQHVTVWRPEGATDSVSLLPALGNAPKYKTTLRERMAPADLTETLLRLWKIPELVDWYRRTHGAAAAAPAAPPPPPPPAARTYPETDLRAKMARHLIDRAGGDQPETVSADATDEALARLTQRDREYKAGRNGNGKK